MEKFGQEVRLKENQLYVIELSLNGVTKTFQFTSRYNPLYTTPKVIRNDFPDIMQDISDDVIYFHIWQASLLAQETANEDHLRDGPSFAVRQFVRYRTEYEIIRNILMTIGAKSGAREKKLGEYSISEKIYPPNLKNILADLKEELMEWEAAIGRRVGVYAAVRGGQSSPFPLRSRLDFTLPSSSQSGGTQ